MKRIIIFCFLVLLSASITSFRYTAEPGIESVSNIVIFYIENSKANNNTSLTAEAIEKLEAEVKKQNATPNNKFLLYWSNDSKFDYTKKAENSNRILNQLFERNSRTPNVWFDKFQMRNLIFDKEFTLKGAITINFFMTEEYLIDYTIKDEPSVLMGLFPREMAYISGVDDSKVTVNVYYSNTSKKITEDLLKRVNNFNDQSKVTYNYIQLK